jgi:kynurenine formamidase
MRTLSRPAHERVDLSYPLSAATPKFPDAPSVEVEALESAEDPPRPERRSLNVTRFSLMVHTGTHMDAPFHFYSSGRTIDEIPLKHCVGLAMLVRLGNLSAQQQIDLTAIAGLEAKLRRIPKVILNTGWAREWGTPEYFSDHPCLTGESAEFLVDCGVHLIGLDMPSVDRPPFPAHLPLLGSGVVIVENLTNLDLIEVNEFEFTALPLSLTGRDGSPVRAIASW